MENKLKKIKDLNEDIKNLKKDVMLMSLITISNITIVSFVYYILISNMKTWDSDAVAMLIFGSFIVGYVLKLQICKYIGIVKELRVKLKERANLI